MDLRTRRRASVGLVVLALVAVQLFEAAPAWAESTWNLVATKCFARKVHAGDLTWIDACWQLHKLTHDGSARKDYFQLTYYGTGGPGPLEDLNALGLRVTPNASPTQQWVDWNPKSDWSGGDCQTIDIGISYVAFFTYTIHQCPDQWGITKGVAAGKFTEAWLNLNGTNENREVGFSIVVKVNQGQRPGWTFWRGSDG